MKDAEVLLKSARFDGATYLCGYAIELGLKARACKTLRWSGFPSTNSEFKNYLSFKTHNLDVLLSLSGAENKIKTKYLTEWSAVASWDSEARYRSLGSATKTDATLMVESAKTLLRVL